MDEVLSSGDTMLNFSEIGMVSPELCSRRVARRISSRGTFGMVGDSLDRLGLIRGRGFATDLSLHRTRPAGVVICYSGLPWCCTQSGMAEPAEDVLGCHVPQRLAHGIIEPRPRPRLGSTEILLDLREHLLDRGVVRAVRR